jgi:hypothetical protein
VLLDDLLLKLVVPSGWFPPVTPGTCFVTIAGALANDVHGKNHHRAGTFGRHVRAFELLRSDGSRLTCAPDMNSALFAATIGGFGLTGLITQVTLQLMPVTSAEMMQEALHFDGLDRFFEIAAESDATHDYTVAWIDSLAPAATASGAASSSAPTMPRPRHALPPTRRPLPFPIKPPIPLINGLTLRIFNLLYRNAQPKIAGAAAHRLSPVLLPARPHRQLESRLWTQGAAAVPMRRADGPGPGRSRGDAAALAGRGGGLIPDRPQAIRRGAVARPDVVPDRRRDPDAGLSQSRGAYGAAAGGTRCRIAIEAGGRVNPYKDARMSPATFEASFPHWRDFARHIDPGFSSSFWRRVTAG